jgi:hypothetical protein
MVLLDSSEKLTDLDSYGGSIAITHSETNRLDFPEHPSVQPRNLRGDN